MFWALFDKIDLDDFETKDKSFEITQETGKVLFAFYSIFAVMVALNMLIAMMTHSYENISVSTKSFMHDAIDIFAEHLRSVRNNDVDKPVARHFNAANHSISDIKVCAISPISGGNDSRKRHEKRLIFKIGTIHPHGLNERFSFI